MCDPVDAEYALPSHPGCCMCVSNRYVCNPVDAKYALPSLPGYCMYVSNRYVCDPVDAEYALPSHPCVTCVFLTGMCAILQMLSMHCLLIQVLHVCF